MIISKSYNSISKKSSCSVIVDGRDVTPRVTVKAADVVDPKTGQVNRLGATIAMSVKAKQAEIRQRQQTLSSKARKESPVVPAPYRDNTEIRTADGREYTIRQAIKVLDNQSPTLVSQERITPFEKDATAVSFLASFDAARSLKALV